MKIKILRFDSDKKCTLGVMLINNVFQCYTLEDGYRKEKVRSETRIPNGTYGMALRRQGALHKRYKERFPFHKGMLWVMDIINFNNVLIHIGNTCSDTSGCILVGNKIGRLLRKKAVLNSEDTYRKIYPVIAKRIEVLHMKSFSAVHLEISSAEGV